MKVAITFLAFGKDIFAGMENALYNFAKGLQANGDEAFIFTSKANGVKTNVDDIPVFCSEHLPLSYANGDRVIISMLNEKKEALQLELKTFLNQYKPDILVAWDPLWGFVQYLNVHEFSDIPTYLSLHVISDDDVLKLSEKHPYKKRFGVSDNFIRQLREKGYISHIDVLPNSIDIKKVQKLGQRSRKFGDRQYIFCNARLSPEKGVKYAVEAFGVFHQKHPEIDLYLCDGDFPFGDKNVVKNEIVELSNKLGISERIKFLPKLPWEDVPSVINHSFCTVLPSLIESFGLAILESLAIGKPTITTKAGNLPFLVQDAGILVDPENSAQIAEALERLFTNDVLYKDLASKAAKRAETFDSSLVAQNFVNFIIRA